MAKNAPFRGHRHGATSWTKVFLLALVISFVVGLGSLLIYKRIVPDRSQITRGESTGANEQTASSVAGGNSSGSAQTTTAGSEANAGTASQPSVNEVETLAGGRREIATVPFWISAAALLSPIALLLAGLLGWAYRHLSSDLKALESQQGQMHSRSLNAEERVPIRADEHWHREAAELRRAIAEGREEVAMLRNELDRVIQAQARSPLSAPRPQPNTPPITAPPITAPPITAPPITAPPVGEPRSRPGTASPVPERVQALTGMLSEDGSVRLSTVSRPMVEIRWRQGEGSPELHVNPDFKFADLTIGLLESAFDMDGSGPGSYETVLPAILDWNPMAESGRIRRRGRVRALRNG